jgi:hypothetical protein
VDPDPGGPKTCGSGEFASGFGSGSATLLSSCKKWKKNLDSFYFVTLFDFLSLKNDGNVPSKSNKQKKLCKKLVCCWHLEGQ